MPPSLPPTVANLLREFMNVFPQDVPPRLPPIRGIEHQIRVYWTKVIFMSLLVHVLFLLFWGRTPGSKLYRDVMCISHTSNE
jgi:hypothetical protein